MKKILLATDLGASCDRAMERALKLAKEQNAKLYIVHALPNYKAKALRSTLKQETEDLIKGYLTDYKDANDVDITIEIDAKQEGPANKHILNAVHKIKPNLIIMGMHSKPKILDMFIGTTLERVARKSTQPLLMVKNKPTGSYQSIVSSTDYAPASRAALRTAMELSPAAAFEIVHVYQAPMACPTTADFALEMFTETEKVQNKAMIAFMNTETAYFKKTFKKPNKKLSHKLVEGVIYNTLAKEVKNWKADLLTIGAHGALVMTHSKLGGIASYILANPPCDVLLVRE
jgi:nucleotide-binding universal stress UspA family protein